MKKVFCSVLAVTGCVMLAGLSVADESSAPGQEMKAAPAGPPQVSASPLEPKVDRWSARRKKFPEPVKEVTRDTLRGKRPK